MNIKLHINISQGIIEVEGDLDLVREIYADFKGKLLQSGLEIASPPTPPEKTSGVSEPGKQHKRRGASRKSSSHADGSSGVIPQKPKMDKNLDTAALPAFYEQFKVSNNSEKILVFMTFLTEKLGIVSPNTDQVYTCFKAVKVSIPKAFAQAFTDAGGRQYGYINYNSATDINITTVGSNHFNLKLKKKAR